MTNVLHLKPQPRTRSLPDQVPLLAECFAHCRRDPEDVFWLKENAELLNVLETAGVPVAPSALHSYEAFFDSLPERFAFFPQYYRFLLSMCLDLEDLGFGGDAAQRLCAATVQGDLIAAELSDLQRAEARRLLLRRGVADRRKDDGLADRLRAFAACPATFALPNKKAAYELTHIVFYLSEYGRRAPDLPPEVEISLQNVGLLAQLEGNIDLLAEVCIALGFAGWTAPPPWLEQVAQATAGFHVDEDALAPLADDYHCYLMCHWHAFLGGASRFGGAITGGRMSFVAAQQHSPALRELSQTLFAMDSRRCADWDRMRGKIAAEVSPDTWHRICAAEDATDRFAGFFEVFARAPRFSSAGLRAV